MVKLELKSARIRLNLSVAEMAKNLNVSKRTYEGWEQGRKIPGVVSNAIKLLEKLKEIK